MTKLLTLSSKLGKVKRLRVGRGNGNGRGTFSGRGCKGQNSRTGARTKPGFEGGQTPFYRRLPKIKGFKNPTKTDYQIIKTSDLNIFDDGTEIKIENLIEKGFANNKKQLIKLLEGKNELTKSVTIHVNKASENAVKKVEEKKGKVIILARREKPAKETPAKK
ncbi:MAG: 50S ribosomal protein L15 [Candidatus Gracilibacteria bacterium]|jgi:large subunit ribosomal protein L15